MCLRSQTAVSTLEPPLSAATAREGAMTARAGTHTDCGTTSFNDMLERARRAKGATWGSYGRLE